MVLTNYAFSQKTEYAGYYGFRYRDANPVFLQHVIDALKPGGRAAVVVPDGVLFDDKSQYLKVRQSLLRNCDVQAVIKLHRFVFKPYAGQPTSIVIFRKGTPTRRIWFFRVDDDGYKKTGSKFGRPPIEANDLLALRHAWDEKEETPRSFTIEIDRIMENGYKLIPNAYVPVSTHTERWAPLGGSGGLCEITIGNTPSTRNAEFWDGTHPWATITDFSSKYIESTGRKITDVAVATAKPRLIPENSVLFSFKLSIGRTAIAGCPLYTNEAIAALIPKDDRVLPEYLYHVLPQLDYTPYQQPATKGETLNKCSLARVLVPVPSIDEQKTVIVTMRQKDEELASYLEQAEGTRRSARQYIQEHIQNA